VEKIHINWLSLTVLILLFTPGSADAQKLKRIPGYCGIYYKNMEDLRKQKEAEIRFLDLHPGETVASVGAQCAHWEAVIAALSDRVHFYLEDIDSTYFNQRQVGFAWHYYDSLRGAPMTSTYTLVLGNEQATLLPDSSFDKILIINSLHEFTNRDGMLQDILLKLRKGGVLYIDEPVPKKSGELHGGCHKPMITESEMAELLERNGFKPEKSYTAQFLRSRPARRIYAFSRP
jgi:hypothetical protein